MNSEDSPPFEFPPPEFGGDNSRHQALTRHHHGQAVAVDIAHAAPQRSVPSGGSPPSSVHAGDEEARPKERLLHEGGICIRCHESHLPRDRRAWAPAAAGCRREARCHPTRNRRARRALPRAYNHSEFWPGILPTPSIASLAAVSPHGGTTSFHHSERTSGRSLKPGPWGIVQPSVSDLCNFAGVSSAMPHKGRARNFGHLCETAATPGWDLSPATPGRHGGCKVPPEARRMTAPRHTTSRRADAQWFSSCGGCGPRTRTLVRPSRATFAPRQQRRWAKTS